MRSAANSRLHERRGGKVWPRKNAVRARRDLALWCQSRMEEGGLVPPHSVLAPGTALELLRRSALPSAQAKRMVGHRTRRLSPSGNEAERRQRTKIRPGC